MLSRPALKIKLAAGESDLVNDAVLRGAHVLLLEDEVLINFALVDLLEQMGLRVTACFDLAGCGAAIDQNLPDAALLDVHIRGTTSYALAERLHAAGVPIIFMTGDAFAMEEETWKNFRRCTKPCAPDELMALLVDALTSGRIRATGRP
jgi:DNA-binding response OmpR family regulator